MPPALAQQLTALPDWLDASGFASLCQDGVEADDWIAALALAAIEAGTPAVIFSPDKDFLQLVSPAIRLLIPGDKSGHLWDEADVRAKTGVAPNQIVDWLSLVGDTVDNIPGIPGVGPKTAASLLAQFGSCDRLLDHLDEVPSDRIRNAIRDGQASLERNREMIRLRADLPPACPLARLSLRSPDPARLAALYRQWGFRGLLASVSSENSGQATFGF
jgi:DNA polymerase-1